MAREIYVAAPIWAGIRHRFISLNHVRTFARYSACKIRFLWGISGGVAHCRFEELFAPVPGVQIVNVPAQELFELEQLCRNSRTLRFRGQQLSVYGPGKPLADKMLAFDLSWDLAATNALEQLAPLRFRPSVPEPAMPGMEIRRFAAVYARRHALARRMGIRVRVTESPNDGRKPRRIQRELDDTIKSIIRLPWYVPVFLVTDSQYVQQMLASHFHDARYLPKRFKERDVGGSYVHRDDKADMRTFVTEVACLSACRKIINIGGFINEHSLWPKTIEAPYELAVFGKIFHA